MAIGLLYGQRRSVRDLRAQKVPARLLIRISFLLSPFGISLPPLRMETATSRKTFAGFPLAREDAGILVG
jgi:hypothetical protein